MPDPADQGRLKRQKMSNYQWAGLAIALACIQLQCAYAAWHSEFEPLEIVPMVGYCFLAEFSDFGSCMILCFVTESREAHAGQQFPDKEAIIVRPPSDSGWLPSRNSSQMQGDF